MNSRVEEMNLLVSALVDGVIDDGDFERLDRLIESDADARALYIRLMHIHAELPRLAVRTEGQTPSEADGIKATEVCDTASHTRPAGMPQLARKVWLAARRPTPVSLTTSAVVLGIIIAVMAYIGIPAYRQSGPGTSTNESPVVASFTRFLNAEWPPEYADGPALHLLAGDRVELRSGFAEITFRDGARVVLEGPASFGALSSNSASIQQGRLTALVPEEAIGFTVSSPCVKLVDLGTEFGMFVEESGATEVKVFEGQVEITQIDAGNTSANQKILVKGESARVTLSQSGIVETEDSPQPYVRPKAFGELVVREQYESWRKFADELKAGADVVALYSFDQPGQSPEALLDSATAQAAPDHGRIDGPAWTVGRWKDKGALQFKHGNDRVQLDFGQDTFEQITLATWFNLEELKHTHNAVFYSNQWNRPGALHWTVLDDGRIELAISGGAPEVVQSDAVMMHRRLGRWVHLAVVYDTRQKNARFYVNGTERGSRSYTHALDVEPQQVQLGSWNQQERNMLGKMDELVIFRRALSGQEIHQIYEAGTP